MLCPCLVGSRIGQIALVQYDETPFILNQLINDRISAGNGNAGIDDFDDDIDHFQILRDQRPSLFHMSRIPVDMFHHAFPPFMTLR